MAITVTDTGRSILVVCTPPDGDRNWDIPYAHIKAVRALSGAVVIERGQQGNDDITLKYDSVTAPASADEEDLRNQIIGFLPDPIGGGEIITELEEINLENNLLQVDQVGNTTYLGYADPGSSTGSGVWAIKRIIETGPDASFTWADGNKNKDNIWDDRLILTYS